MWRGQGCGGGRGVEGAGVWRGQEERSGWMGGSRVGWGAPAVSCSACTVWMKRRQGENKGSIPRACAVGVPRALHEWDQGVDGRGGGRGVEGAGGAVRADRWVGMGWGAPAVSCSACTVWRKRRQGGQGVDWRGGGGGRRGETHTCTHRWHTSGGAAVQGARQRRGGRRKPLPPPVPLSLHMPAVPVPQQPRLADARFVGHHHRCMHDVKRQALGAWCKVSSGRR